MPKEYSKLAISSFTKDNSDYELLGKKKTIVNLREAAIAPSIIPIIDRLFKPKVLYSQTARDQYQSTLYARRAMTILDNNWNFNLPAEVGLYVEASWNPTNPLDLPSSLINVGPIVEHFKWGNELNGIQRLDLEVVVGETVSNIRMYSRRNSTSYNLFLSRLVEEILLNKEISLTTDPKVASMTLDNLAK